MALIPAQGLKQHIYQYIINVGAAAVFIRVNIGDKARYCLKALYLLRKLIHIGHKAVRPICGKAAKGRGGQL